MIKRHLLHCVRNHLDHKEISFIVGPRQAGKTTLMLQLKKELEDKGTPTVFLNLDIEHEKIFFSSQLNLLNKIQLDIGKKYGCVFIDEIQRKENAGLFLKGIYDMNTPYKFIVSGSGSVELKEMIHESLAGRKRTFELSTVSFDEFVDYRTNYRYTRKLPDFYAIENDQRFALLEEYLNFGGYPRIVTESKLEEKRNLIGEIYQSYIERDISYLLKIRKTEAFSNLCKLLATQSGKMINYTELSSTLGISSKTIKEYLWFLEKTFIIKKVAPFYRNVRKEITKSPVYYFYDLGLRNYALGVFGRLTEKGFVFQNLIHNLLRERISNTSAKICFWRSKDRAEVDFILDSGKMIVPIEVKYKQMTDAEITKSLRSFIDKYKPKTSFVVNLTLEKVITVNGTKIQFIPFYKIRTHSLFM